MAGIALRRAIQIVIVLCGAVGLQIRLLDKIRRDPFVMIVRARHVEIGQELGCQPVRDCDGTDRRARTHAEFAAIAQGRVELEFSEAPGRVDDARDTEAYLVTPAAPARS